ncbi:hypothetical protein OJF2_00450 [Aquisphaera giovannonii]|uniref:Uncharacterized protein n=1 Tax=Aquisphaera giovannonii TaxID=406548 RepID=A0A5B9VUW3_9BACT|nr:hypothetical protein [Aquisphaera giovannonii]QEH31580.1 hypothetical protein OJF2_00450 [Aquisphaera giovannonii]
MGDTGYANPPAPGPSVRVINGVIQPDAATIRTVLLELRRAMEQKPELAQRFQDDPGRVLGDIGLNREIQAEFMEEEGMEVPEGLDCAVTGCACTGCCVTSFG